MPLTINDKVQMCYIYLRPIHFECMWYCLFIYLLSLLNLKIDQLTSHILYSINYIASVHISVIKNIPVFRLTNFVVTTTNKIFKLFVIHYSSADTMLTNRIGCLYMCYSVIYNAIA